MNKLPVIARRHVYSTHAFIRVCPRHGSLSQEDDIAKAHRFADVDEAIGILAARNERIDRFHFFYVDGDQIVGQAFQADYCI